MKPGDDIREYLPVFQAVLVNSVTTNKRARNHGNKNRSGMEKFDAFEEIDILNIVQGQGNATK